VIKPLLRVRESCPAKIDQLVQEQCRLTVTGVVYWPSCQMEDNITLRTSFYRHIFCVYNCFVIFVLANVTELMC